jgi:hypothetical protein
MLRSPSSVRRRATVPSGGGAMTTALHQRFKMARAASRPGR